MQPPTHPSVTYSSLEDQGAAAQNHEMMTCNEAHQEPPSKPDMSLRRLGRTSLRTLFLGSLVLPLIFIFLALLWVDAIKLAVDQDAQKSWVSRLNTDWTTRLVTISTAVIRTAVDFQATLATAMIAGIMLERIGIPLHKAPFYSIIRAVDVAPSNLLLAGKIRFKRVTRASFLIYTIITVEVLVIIATQFLSTIFLSDFDNATVPSPFNVTTVPIFTTNDTDLRNLWLTPPSSSWTFAEAPSDPLLIEADFHDTGHVYRGLLPLEDDVERPKLRKFAGPLPIIDHRVTCLSPRLINLGFDFNNNAPVQSRPRLVGRALINIASYPMLRIGNGGNEENSGNFTCALPSGDELDDSKRQITLCWPFSMNDGLPGNAWKISMEDRLVPSLDIGSQVVLVVDVVNASALNRAYQSSKASFSTGGNDGPWAVLKNIRDVETLRVTACLTELSFQNFEANIHSSWDAREPRLSLSRENPGSYNTEALRWQLGATLNRDSLDERGILTLEPRPEWTTFNEATNIPADPLYFERSLTSALPGQSNDSFVFLSNTNPGVRVPTEAVFFAHTSHVNLFQDTLNDTKSPALALQAVLTRMTQMLYYDRITQLDERRAAWTSFATIAFLPVRWTGFVGAVVIIATHLAIVVTVTVLFLKVTVHSHIGSYWQAIAQVVTKDTIPILEQLDGMKDKEIKTWAKDRPLDIKQNGILRRREDGRVAFSMVP